MAVPVQLTTNVQNETFGGVTYHIEGELVPALHLPPAEAQQPHFVSALYRRHARDLGAAPG